METKEKAAELDQLSRQVALLKEEKAELVKRVKDLSIQGKEKTALIRNLFDYLPNGVVMFDHNRQVIQANQAAANVFSIEKRELIGKRCTDLFHCYEKNDSCPVLDQHQSINKLRTQTHQCDSVILRSAVLNKDDNNTVVVETMVDVTEIEIANREKTLALQTKSNFLANVSHELRTPMHGILGCSNLLSSKKHELPEKLQVYLETLDKSSNRLWSLIEKLFEASNLEEDSVKLQLSTFECRNFFYELETEFHMRVDGYTNQVSFSYPAQEYLIVTDSIRLHQIIMTLLENASKYTEKGQIECHSQLIERESRSRLVVEVKDTGIGISPEKQQQVFNLFEQENGNADRSYQGAGLGLAIARQLSNLMGGDISLQSTPGEGSVFTLKVPVEIKM